MYNASNIAKLYNPILRFSYIQPLVVPFNILYNSFPYPIYTYYDQLVQWCTVLLYHIHVL